eukprot:7916282-Alexandrium_andersonii.AAC.1
MSDDDWGAYAMRAAHHFSRFSRGRVVVQADASAGSAEAALPARLLARLPWTVVPDARRGASGFQL